MYHARGVRHTAALLVGRPPLLNVGSRDCKRFSQTTIATAAKTQFVLNAIRHPNQCANGTMLMENNAPKKPIITVLKPVAVGMRLAKSRLITLGSNTLPNTIPIPKQAVP